MNRMKIVLSIVFLFSGVAVGQDSMTVEQAVQRVLQTHPAIEQGLANTRAAEARAQQTSSMRMPDADIEASYTYLGPPIPFYFGVLGPFQFYPNNNYDAHVGAGYMLYDFGKTSAAIDAAQSHVQSARNMVELTKNGLGYQTIRTFYTILFLQKSIQVADEQIETFNEHLSLTRKKVNVGTATSFDVLTTEVRVASAQNQKVELENSLHQQESILRQLLGKKEATPITLVGEFTMTPVTLNSDSLVEQAFAQRVELKLDHDAQMTADLQYKVAYHGNMPSLHISGEYGVKNGLYFPDLNIIRGNWALGAQLRVPVFDGYRVDHMEEETQAEIRAEQAHTQNTERQIRSDVEQTLADLQASAMKVEITKVQLQQAHEAVAIARTRYETGSITNLDLLDAETAESTSKLMSLQALYRYVISKYELEHAVGGSFSH